jgi:hypothetical protein
MTLFLSRIGVSSVTSSNRPLSVSSCPKAKKPPPWVPLRQAAVNRVKDSEEFNVGKGVYAATVAKEQAYTLQVRVLRAIKDEETGASIRLSSLVHIFSILWKE